MDLFFTIISNSDYRYRNSILFALKDSICSGKENETNFSSETIEIMLNLLSYSNDMKILSLVIKSIALKIEEIDGMSF
jgi:hypothetical protein